MNAANPPHYQHTKIEEQIHGSKVIDVEQKRITVQRVENQRGQFLRIIEERRNGRTMVVIPAAGLDDVQNAIDEIFPEEGE